MCSGSVYCKDDPSVHAFTMPVKDGHIQTTPTSGKTSTKVSGEWDREGCFDNAGGTLVKKGSAVELFVPENAVEPLDTASISGKVFTNLNPFRDMFQLTERERFISPVVEFKEHNDIQFSHHLEIKIPIACDSQSDINVRVLSHQGGDKRTLVEIEKVANTSDENKPLLYYKLQDGFVCVFTKHFSLFCCAGFSTKNIDLEVLLFGSRLDHSEGSEVGLRLYLGNSLGLIEDFKKTLIDTENQFDRKYLDRKRIITKDLHSSDKIDTRIFLTEPWTLKTKPDGKCLFQMNEQMLDDIWRCFEASEFTLFGEWKATTTQTDVLFNCYIDVVHEGNNPVLITFDVTMREQLSTNQPRSRPSYDRVNAILMEDLNLKDARNLAREMKMNGTSIDHISDNNKGDACEFVKQLVDSLQQQHGSRFNETLLISLEHLRLRRVMERIVEVLRSPNTETPMGNGSETTPSTSGSCTEFQTTV